jgi:DNA-binding MarR family transcriptional regulator
MGIESLNIFKPSEEMRNLVLLEELEKNPIISQRELSHRFNIALGVTNACLKKMAQKGWIRVQGLNRRKIGYYLTPKGMTEKAKLTFHLISYTVQYYSDLKKRIGHKFLEMEREGLERIVFYGVSDEMEVAFITLQGVNLRLVGIVEDDEKFRSQILFGYELERVSQIKELKPNGVLITSLTDIEKKRERIRTIFGQERVRVSDICLE